MIIGFSPMVMASDASPLFDLSGSLPEISPELDRRQVALPKVDALDVEVGVFAGTLSVEDFGANYFYGVSVAFHATEDFFLNGNAGFSSISDETYRRLDLPLFGASERKVKDYNLLLGWNVLPGEMFLTSGYTMTSSLYLLAGVGTINYDSEDYFNMLVGAGVKVLLKDWLAIKMESKISQYDSTLLGYKKTSHNVDIITGLSIFY